MYYTRFSAKGLDTVQHSSNLLLPSPAQSSSLSGSLRSHDQIVFVPRPFLYVYKWRLLHMRSTCCTLPAPTTWQLQFLNSTHGLSDYCKAMDTAQLPVQACTAVSHLTVSNRDHPKEYARIFLVQ
jgi:hypothetical protein